MAAVKEINGAEFDTEVISSSTPTVVDFWAPWCGPCRIVGPILEELAEELGETVQFVKVNVDENQELASRFGIRGIPTLLFVKDGEIVDGQVGALPKDALRSKVGTAFK
ncbi:MAG: thioredoxin [Candidatus Eisenbacteria bacterium]